MNKLEDMLTEEFLVGVPEEIKEDFPRINIIFKSIKEIINLDAKVWEISQCVFPDVLKEPSKEEEEEILLQIRQEVFKLHRLLHSSDSSSETHYGYHPWIDGVVIVPIGNDNSHNYRLRKPIIDSVVLSNNEPVENSHFFSVESRWGGNYMSKSKACWRYPTEKELAKFLVKMFKSLSRTEKLSLFRFYGA